MNRAARSAALLLLLAPLAGCAGDDPVESSGPNLLVVVVDTLRADHLGVYGYERDTSPWIDVFAREGVRFERAYTAAPWTLPSVASLMTGRHPTSHGATHVTHVVDESVPTLAERLRERGWRTGAIIGNVYTGERHGLSRGYELFRTDEAKGADHVSTAGITKLARELIDELSTGDEPFYLFVHYFDPHENYHPHPEFGWARRGGTGIGPNEPVRQVRKRRHRLPPADVQQLVDLYDEEIGFTDRGIGRLLDHLDERGLFDETLVVLTADHGEEFMERGWIGHVESLHDELMRVPLVFRGPGLASGRIVDEVVTTVSLTPTLLDLLGVGASTTHFEAPSLAPLLRASRGAWEPAAAFLEVDMFEWRAGPDIFQKGVVHRGHKLVRDDRTGTVELYDLAADPGERTDLAAKRPELVAELLELLEAHRAAVETRAPRTHAIELDAAGRAELQDLGYAGDDD